MDRLQSDIDKEKHSKRRKRLRMAWNRISERRINWVRDFHYRYAHWLCQHYRVILLPTYDTRKMVIRSNRVINSKVVRGMMNWRSGAFRAMLQYVSRQYRDCHVAIVDEANTSVTCGRCGRIRRKFSDDTFQCPSCQWRWGRDWNGARNILLRVDYQST